MKRTPIILLFLFFFCQAAIALAVEKEVTVTWSMADTTNVSGYRLYYDYDSSMNNKTLACETTDPAATSLTCTNVDLQQSPVYFTLVAIKDNAGVASQPASQTFDTGTATISVVKNFKMEINTGTPITNHSDYKINFQPANSNIPPGYITDSGAGFSETRGYGWVTGPSSMGTRDRDSSDAHDQAYDTMIHVSPTSTWEITVPNGSYSVTICNGDASYPTGTQNVQAEGITVIDNVVLSSTTQWVERTATVSVTDGRLSVTFTGSSDPARLCWLTITSIN